MFFTFTPGHLAVPFFPHLLPLIHFRIPASVPGTQDTVRSHPWVGLDSPTSTQQDSSLPGETAPRGLQDGSQACWKPKLSFHKAHILGDLQPQILLQKVPSSGKA